LTTGLTYADSDRSDEDDLQENVKGLFDNTAGFGEKAAIVVIDFCNAYVTPGHALCCSPTEDHGVAAAVQRSVPLLAAARCKGIPIYYTRVLYNKEGAFDGGVFVQKVPILKTFTADNPMTEIVPSLTPAPEDTIIIKQYPSAFFGTPLAASLTARRVDTIILIGCSTSGCIRASALDGMQHGFRMIIPKQCVGDRHKAVHDANLFDINAKNGDVLELDEVMRHIAGL